MRRRVLYVDDTPSSRDALREYCTRELPGVDLITAATASEGLEICADRTLDCIVSAYQLSGMDGLEFLEYVRDTHPDLPFILFTAAGSETVASEAIASGVSEYVQKGGDEQFDLLAARIDDAIDRYHSRTGYRDLFEAIGDAIIVHDPETGDVVDVNRAVCEHWGYSHEQACECAIEELSAAVQPASERTAREWVRRTAEEGPQRVEWVCETSDGMQFRADVRLKPATINGRDRVIALIRDITEEKHREQELKAFREAVEHAGHSIYITDSDEEILYVNPAFEEVTGYTADEAIGRTPRLLQSGEHDDEFYDQLWETILAGEDWQNELINERKDGSRYVVNQTIAPITDEMGEIVRFVAVNAEITEQKRRERQLQALYTATTEWLDAESKDDVYELVSTQLTDLLEFDLHGFCLYDESTHTLQSVVTSEHADVVLDDFPEFEEGEGIVWTVFESGNAERCDDVREHPDVYNPDTEIRSELVLPLGGHGVLLIGSKEPSAFDDTDETLAKVLSSALTEVLSRIEREGELAERNSRLEEFANVVSHDLRNPLSVARGHLELARDTGDETHLEEVEQSHDRMERIIQNLLWLAREGREIGETRRVDLAYTVEDAWRHVDTKEARLVGSVDRTIEADPDRLQQLFENLFRNAIQHGGSDVTVDVGVLDDGFYVEDDGPGIPEATREHVFEAGYSSSPDGTGYGLSIVQTIAEAHGWNLDITDGTAGGVRFEFSGVGFGGEARTEY
ncbi:PAS domain S-box protein [Natrialba swarupiae]|uniref:histidine kinase n=1 Tax=Natrialba swarupiae TaxID=2448032 RepID=A0A5D5APM7_9EURY|nr:PAS domain S-box protein [Natrialba swarupiae]TYT62835.1 PAS domain S-box protein [Natrialba swarupiae]